MKYETEVLKAMLRLARRRVAANVNQILVRIGGTPAEFRTALRQLERAGFVDRTATRSGRLTLAGFAVAVAAAATKTRQKRSSTGARSSPSKRHAA